MGSVCVLTWQTVYEFNTTILYIYIYIYSLSFSSWESNGRKIVVHASRNRKCWNQTKNHLRGKIILYRYDGTELGPGKRKPNKHMDTETYIYIYTCIYMYIIYIYNINNEENKNKKTKLQYSCDVWIWALSLNTHTLSYWAWVMRTNCLLYFILCWEYAASQFIIVKMCCVSGFNACDVWHVCVCVCACVIIILLCGAYQLSGN